MSLLTPTPAPILAAGELTLDCGAKVLGGPSGSLPVSAGVYPILRELMTQPGKLVRLELLISACWPDADLEPDGALQAVRQRVRRARDLLTAVGVSRDMLKLRFMDGYSIAGERRVVRTFTPAQAATVDAWLASQDDASRQAGAVR